jgi:hypothetical protein
MSKKGILLQDFQGPSSLTHCVRYEVLSHFLIKICLLSHIMRVLFCLMYDGDCLVGCCAVQTGINLKFISVQRSVLPPSWRRWASIIALIMEAVRTSETLVNSYQSAWRCNPEDGHFLIHHRENLKVYLSDVQVGNLWITLRVYCARGRLMFVLDQKYCSCCFAYSVVFKLFWIVLAQVVHMTFLSLGCSGQCDIRHSN